MNVQVLNDHAFASTVALAGAGDKAAFARLVATYNADMARVAFVICGDRDLAEDAVQSASALRSFSVAPVASRVPSGLHATAVTSPG